MLKQSLYAEDIGSLRIRGKMALGQVESIMNLDSGLYLDFSGNQNLLSIVVEEDGRMTEVQINEFLFEPDTGILTHQDKGIQLYLRWLCFDHDTVICRLKFLLTTPRAIVRKIVFKLPEVLGFAEKNNTNFLVYPRAGGMRIPNPSTEFFREKKIKTAKWRDRTLSVWEHGFDTAAEENLYELNFSPSMNWLDYYSEKGGLYLASHDPLFEQTEMTVSARTPHSGLVFKIAKTLNRREIEYETDFVIGLHDGDWHRGADIYRKFFDSTKRTIKKLPRFMENSVGIMCHYDFKWQDGQINHRFCDIPYLYNDAVKNGFCEILVAGWNVDGFDNSYPNFRPDPELGTEQELIEAIKQVQTAGGNVFFYVNAYSYDEKSPDFAHEGDLWSIKKYDMSRYSGQWGSSVLAGMCNSCHGWREKVKDNIRYIIDTLGAAGVYIDQLNATTLTCYDSSHRHEKSSRLNNLQIINEIRTGLGPEYEDKIFLFSEWLTDILATELDSQLIHVCWMGGIKYAFPEMFRYTFPEAALLDQVLQKPWSGEPPEVENNHVKDIICRMFINGILFWTYDHVPDTRDIETFFKQTISLKKRILRELAGSKFVDDVPIEKISGDAEVKAYEMVNDQMAYLVWNRMGTNGKFSLKEGKKISRLKICDFNGDTSAVIEGPVKTVEFPASELSVIIMED